MHRFHQGIAGWSVIISNTLETRDISAHYHSLLSRAKWSRASRLGTDRTESRMGCNQLQMMTLIEGTWLSQCRVAPVPLSQYLKRCLTAQPYVLTTKQMSLIHPREEYSADFGTQPQSSKSRVRMICVIVHIIPHVPALGAEEA